ncbi:hypothetical protein HY988_01925 [Candidatus Micrarchaeota archaeon]|nr:hypothetical protein [Candidatus Micrarchaeota archaeon]
MRRRRADPTSTLQAPPSLGAPTTLSIRPLASCNVVVFTIFEELTFDSLTRNLSGQLRESVVDITKHDCHLPPFLDRELVAHALSAGREKDIAIFTFYDEYKYSEEAERIRSFISELRVLNPNIKIVFMVAVRDSGGAGVADLVLENKVLRDGSLENELQRMLDLPAAK